MAFFFNPFTGNLDLSGGATGPAGPATLTLNSTTSPVLSITADVLSADDAGSDQIVFWDDSAGAWAYLQLGSNLAISGTTLNATDTDTTYSAGTGLDLTGTTFSIDATVVTLSGAQTLANKILGEVKETLFTITDAAAFEIDPANGPLQTVTLGANRTPAATNFESGQSVKLKIDDGTAFTITWTTVGVVWIGQVPGSSGTAPSLGTTGFTHIELWKEGSTVYGSLIGYTAT